MGTDKLKSKRIRKSTISRYATALIHLLNAPGRVDVDWPRHPAHAETTIECEFACYAGDLIYPTRTTSGQRIYGNTEIAKPQQIVQSKSMQPISR